LWSRKHKFVRWQPSCRLFSADIASLISSRSGDGMAALAEHLSARIAAALRA